MFASEDRELGHRVGLNLDERAVHALSAAVEYTLNKWAGEGDMDQEELLCLKPFLQGAKPEFQFQRNALGE